MSFFTRHNKDQPAVIGSRLPSSIFRPDEMTSEERYLDLVTRIENNRAIIAQHCIRNVAIISELEQEMEFNDPSGRDYYQKVMEAFADATADTVYGYGRGNPRKLITK